MSPASPPRVGLLADLGDGAAAMPWLAVRMARRDLARRLPGVVVTSYSLSATAGPWDGGDEAVALRDRTTEARASLGAELDAVLVLPSPGGPDGTWPPPEGFGRGGGPTVAVDPAVLVSLAPQLLDPRVVAQRLEWLRLVGWYPPGSPVVVDVEGAAEPEAAVAGMARLLTSRPEVPLVVRGGQAEASVAASVVPEAITPEDVAAVHAAAGAVVGVSPASRLLTLAYGRPWLTLEGADVGGRLDRVLAEGTTHREDGIEPALGTAQAGAVAALEEVAAAARAAANRRGWAAGRGQEDGCWATLRDRAREVRSRRLAEEGLLLAELLGEEAVHRAGLERRFVELRQRASEAWAEQDTLRRRSAELDRVSARLGQVEAERQNLGRELEALRQTRLFRWTVLPRRVYRALRRL